MSGFGLNLTGNRQHLLDLFFGAVDSLLVLAGTLLSVFLTHPNQADCCNILSNEYVIMRIMLLVFLIQLGFYFFDLYNPKLCSEQRKKMLILFLQSLGISFLLISVLYYLIPPLALGRGMLALSLILTFIFSFSWRLLYAMLFEFKALAERVLIIGTGPLARRIGTEISKDGYRGLEIVGFIDENGQRIGESI